MKGRTRRTGPVVLGSRGLWAGAVPVRSAVLAGALAVATAVSSPPALHAQIVQGRVLESGSERPVTLAQVALLDTTMTVVAATFTDHEGAFEVQAPAPGDYYIVADRVGYKPVLDGVIELGEGGVLPVELYMIVQVIQLEGMTATARQRRIDAQLENFGFWERAGAGFGKYITPDDILARPPLDIPQLLRDIPAVRFQRGANGNVPFLRARGSGGADRLDDTVPPGYCRPRIYVNGMQVSTEPRHRDTDPFNEDAGVQITPVPIEQIVDEEDVIAVEVYPSGSNVPFQWNTQGSCGVILFWTDGGE